MGARRATSSGVAHESVPPRQFVMRVRDQSPRTSCSWRRRDSVRRGGPLSLRGARSEDSGGANPAMHRVGARCAPRARTPPPRTGRVRGRFPPGLEYGLLLCSRDSSPRHRRPAAAEGFVQAHSERLLSFDGGRRARAGALHGTLAGGDEVMAAETSRWPASVGRRTQVTPSCSRSRLCTPAGQCDVATEALDPQGFNGGSASAICGRCRQTGQRCRGPAASPGGAHGAFVVSRAARVHARRRRRSSGP